MNPSFSVDLGPQPGTSATSALVTTTAVNVDFAINGPTSHIEAAFTGIAGPKGDTGPTGSVGPQGIPGLTGPTGPTGPTGAQGAQGIQGIQGPAGTNGTNGAVWRDGAGAPSNTLGANGDYYLNDTTGDVYLRSTGTYAIVANIKGAQGVQGIPGTNGTNGTNGTSGSVWYNGTAAPSTLHNNGDYYLNTSTGDVYQQTAGAWGSPIENLTGPAGSGSGTSDVTGPGGTGNAGSVPVFGDDGGTTLVKSTIDNTGGGLAVDGPITSKGSGSNYSLANGGNQQVFNVATGSSVLSGGTAPYANMMLDGTTYLPLIVLDEVAPTGITTDQQYAGASLLYQDNTDHKLKVSINGGTIDNVATEGYVAAHAGTPADATTTTKGIIKLAGDLAGTAAAPTVPGLASKASLTGTETLTNKTLTTPIVTTLTVKDTTDLTKIGIIDASVIQTGTTKTFRLPALPSSIDTLVARTETATLSNKTLDNTDTVTLKSSLFTLQSPTDATKQAKFDASFIPTATTVTFTLPGVGGNLILNNTSDTFTNKSISGATNTLTNIPESAVTNLTTDLAAKAPLASPALTGSPTAPTQTAGDNSTKIATTAYVDKGAAVSNKKHTVPTGTINGTNMAFTVPDTYAAGTLELYLNGQRLVPGASADYVETSNGFTMNYAPATGDVLDADYLLSNLTFAQGTNSFAIGEVPTGTINGTNKAFTTLQAKYIGGSLAVMVNGLEQQRGVDFTETTPASGIFTFTTAPLTGDVVTVLYQFATAASANADTVDGFHASSTPTANNLLPLDSNGTYPQSTVQTSTLGYAEITASFSTASATAVQVTGLTVTVTIPAGGRRVRITVNGDSFYNNTINDYVQATIWDGAVGTGTQLAAAAVQSSVASQAVPLSRSAIVTPPAGSKTYNIGLNIVTGGTGTLFASATSKAYIHVELI